MPKYQVSRVFATQYVWTVKASSRKKALAMLDDDSQTPTDMGTENWLGPAQQYTRLELADEVAIYPSGKYRCQLCGSKTRNKKWCSLCNKEWSDTEGLILKEHKRRQNRKTKTEVKNG